MNRRVLVDSCTLFILGHNIIYHGFGRWADFTVRVFLFGLSHCKLNNSTSIGVARIFGWKDGTGIYDGSSENLLTIPFENSISTSLCARLGALFLQSPFLACKKTFCGWGHLPPVPPGYAYVNKAHVQKL